MGSSLFAHIPNQGIKKYYGGKDFEVVVKNNRAENGDVQPYALNGKALSEPCLPLAKVLKGWRLVVPMGKEPKDQRKGRPR